MSEPSAVLQGLYLCLYLLQLGTEVDEPSGEGSLGAGRLVIWQVEDGGPVPQAASKVDEEDGLHPLP